MSEGYFLTFIMSIHGGCAAAWGALRAGLRALVGATLHSLFKVAVGISKVFDGKVAESTVRQENSGSKAERNGEIRDKSRMFEVA